MFVSAVSGYELALKVRSGELPGAEELEANFLSDLTSAGYTVLPVTGAVALEAGRLSGRPKDTFDRMIVAQALEEKLALISIDAKLDGFGVRRIW